MNTDYVSVSICGFTRLYDENGFVAQVVRSRAKEIDEVCSEHSKSERRLEHIRNRMHKVNEIEDAAREQIESGT